MIKSGEFHLFFMNHVNNANVMTECSNSIIFQVFHKIVNIGSDNAQKTMPDVENLFEGTQLLY